MKMVYAVAAAVCLSAAPSLATTLDASNYGDCLGNVSCTVGGFEITANPDGAVLSEQDYRGLAGLGVDGPTDGTTSRDNEIQPYRAEYIDIVLTGFGDMGIALTQITLGHLYNPTEFGSDPVEIATIIATMFDDSIRELSVFSTSNAPDGFMVVGEGTGVRDSTFTGQFTLTNLFGGAAVKMLRFTGDDEPFFNDGTDYSIVSVSVVPLPASALLLLAGVGGLAAMKRRKKA